MRLRKYKTIKCASLSMVAAMMVYATAALAQGANDNRAHPGYPAENLHLVPGFIANALAVSPRVGHLHVTVDDAPWVWAEASVNPIILMGLCPGPHKLRIEWADANQSILDKGEIASSCRKPKQSKKRPSN